MSKSRNIIAGRLTIDSGFDLDNHKLPITTLAIQASEIHYDVLIKLINCFDSLQQICIDRYSLINLISNLISKNDESESDEDEEESTDDKRRLAELQKFNRLLREKNIHLIDIENYQGELNKTLINDEVQQNNIDQFPEVDSKFNAEKFLNHKPTNSNFEFNDMADGYGIKETKCQVMITQRLCQYIILMGLDKSDIPEINDGICEDLSKLFCSMTLGEWDEFYYSSAKMGWL